MNKPRVPLRMCLICDLLLSRQFVWTLSALCGSHVSFGFVYDRPRRSGEDGSAAKTECEYARPDTVTDTAVKMTVKPTPASEGLFTARCDP